MTDLDFKTQELMDELRAFAGSAQSDPFFQKAIRILGHDRVRMELGEVRHAVQEGKPIHAPVRVLLKLLKKTMDSTGGAEVPKKLQLVPYSKDQANLLVHFSGGKFKEEDLEGPEFNMEEPYSRKFIQLPSFLTSDFFTIPSNKKKSDSVIVHLRTQDGGMVKAQMIRGRTGPGAKQRGILTTEHLRVLESLEALWVDQGCRYRKTTTGAALCRFQVELSSLARMIGLSNFGGRDYQRLEDQTYDLRVMPYAIVLNGERVPFTFLERANVFGQKVGKHERVFLDVIFSEVYSRSLLARRALSRPRDMITMRSGIASLIRLYIEPILLAKKPEDPPHKIRLSKLIHRLNLPSAKWHAHKSTRFREFKSAIRDLNGRTTHDGRRFGLAIADGADKSDNVLISRLCSPEPPPYHSSLAEHLESVRRLRDVLNTLEILRNKC